MFIPAVRLDFVKRRPFEPLVFGWCTSPLCSAFGAFLLFTFIIFISTCIYVLFFLVVGIHFSQFFPTCNFLKISCLAHNLDFLPRAACALRSPPFLQIYPLGWVFKSPAQSLRSDSKAPTPLPLFFDFFRTSATVPPENDSGPSAVPNPFCPSLSTRPSDPSKTAFFFCIQTL